MSHARDGYYPSFEDFTDETLVEILKDCAENGRDKRVGSGPLSVRLQEVGRGVAGELWMRGWTLTRLTSKIDSVDITDHSGGEMTLTYPRVEE